MADVGPLGLFAFGLTTALLQVRTRAFALVAGFLRKTLPGSGICTATEVDGCLQGATTKWTYDGSGMQVENTEQVTYCYALFYGGLTQLLAGDCMSVSDSASSLLWDCGALIPSILAGMWAIYRNNTFAGVAFSSYGAFWLAYGIYGILSSVRHNFVCRQTLGAVCIVICRLRIWVDS